MEKVTDGDLEKIPLRQTRAMQIRDTMAEYFISPEGSIPHQWKYK
jgi:hypothetical protein